MRPGRDPASSAFSFKETMARSLHDQYTVARPDFFEDKDAHKYPHIGGVFHDVVPDGENAITMHGLTYDATPPEGEPRPEPRANKRSKK